MIYAGDELNAREWVFLEPLYERAYWTKTVWMNGKPMWLRAYPVECKPRSFGQLAFDLHCETLMESMAAQDRWNRVHFPHCYE